MLLLGQAKSDAKKPPKPDVGSGRIAWFDITTIDMAKSREFYGKLFDWKFTELAGTNLAVEIVAGDTAIGSLRVAEGPISAYDGVVYVQVPDIQASCNKAKDLGAKVVPGFPFDLSDGRGAIGLFTDPAGHPMGVYSRTPIAKEKPVK
jgi:predicted enzyme related to lactoylglutathione lyase